MRLEAANSALFAGGEMRGLAREHAGFDRFFLGFPFRKAAVEDENVFDAEDAERPPHARRREEAGAVIDHDLVAVRNPEPRHVQLENMRRRQHMRETPAVIGDLVDVEEHRAGNVRCEIFLEAVAIFRRQIP